MISLIVTNSKIDLIVRDVKLLLASRLHFNFDYFHRGQVKQDEMYMNKWWKNIYEMN